MHRNGKFYVYSSTDRPGWPPTKEEIVRRLNRVTLYAQFAEISSQAKHYPLPTYRSPADFPPLNRQTKNKGEKEETSVIPEIKDSIEFGDHNVAPGHKRRVFSIPKPPVLRRSPIGTRSGARRIKS